MLLVAEVKKERKKKKEERENSTDAGDFVEDCQTSFLEEIKYPAQDPSLVSCALKK